MLSLTLLCMFALYLADFYLLRVPSYLCPDLHALAALNALQQLSCLFCQTHVPESLLYLSLQRHFLGAGGASRHGGEALLVPRALCHLGSRDDRRRRKDAEPNAGSRHIQASGGGRVCAAHLSARQEQQAVRFPTFGNEGA